MKPKNIALNNNKGVALILTLGIASILLTLSMAYVGGAIQENNLCQRYQGSLVGLYEAERGLNYAVIEARNAGWNSFLTHNITNTSNTTKLSNVANTPNCFLNITNSSDRSIGFEPDGDYTILSPTARTEVRTYRNPAISDTDFFVLARTTVLATGTQKILKMRIGTTSLYDYLMFTPFDMVLGGIDGRGLGKIHTNGNLLFWGDAVNVEEVSSAGFMRPNYWNRIPAYLLDGLDGVMDGRAPEPDCSDNMCRWNPTDYDTWFNNLTAAQEATAVPRPPGGFTQDVGNYPWMKLDWNYNNTKGFTWHPRWSDIQNDFNSLKQGTGVCPTCKGSYYNWNEQISSYHYGLPPVFYSPPYTNVPGYNFTAYAGNNYEFDTLQQKLNTTQVSSLFYDAIKVNGVQIPKELSSGEAYDFDPFFQDPVVDDIHSVRYTNTELQPKGWKAWVNSNAAEIKKKKVNGIVPPHAGEPLGAVLKDRNTGGEYVDPVPVDSNYFKDMARTKGILIQADGKTNRDDLCPDIISNSTFFNDLRPYRENNTEYKDKVVNINVQALRSCAAISNNFNGVIYFDGKDCRDCGVRLKNAKDLPPKSTANANGGLTVFSTRQVYLQGDFNYDSTKDEASNKKTWQPASVIATNMVYYLSNGFNDPQTLPVTVAGINSPQIPDPPNYWKDNVGKMPNQAAPEKGSNNTVTYRTAIVSINDLWQDNPLERWTDKQGENDKTYANYKRRTIGAQVRIEGDNTFIPNVWDRGRTIGCCTPILWPYTGDGATFEYDPELQNRTPPGDFLGGSQVSWQEVESFDQA